MFQDNPLLAQLKQQLHSQTPRVEGVVKGTEKGFGFLEVDAQKSYFIPPPFMKKVMHGDRIVATIRTEKEREIAEPESLVEPMLSRFVGRLQLKEDRLAVVPDHPLIKDVIPSRPVRNLEHEFETGDWVVAEMRRHPLKGDRHFFAEITQFITGGDDHFAPWWVTLARHNLECRAPAFAGELNLSDDSVAREDLTGLDFITIDSASTEDMDDALHVASGEGDSLTLTIAIADPTAYVPAGSALDLIARDRAFTNYLPGFNIPMLPRDLSDNLCSLRPHERRPVLACRVTVGGDGALLDKPGFFNAWIESKAKLAYDDVSDWLENAGDWQPGSDAVAEQIRLLHRMSLARAAWRQQHALVFKDRPDYLFVLDDKGDVLSIQAEPRRVANRMVEEAMIAANICAARVLRDGPGYGIYNVHNGFDETLVEQAVAVLASNGIQTDAAALMTLPGFCDLRRRLDAMPTSYLDSRIRRFQTFAEISSEPGPHYGLGLESYATWTSPIRKYGDMINHRLLKDLITGSASQRPTEDVIARLTERRRLNRMAERDVGDWLYARFLKGKVGDRVHYPAEIIDISRGGMRVRLCENGAVAFIPAPFIHSVRDELVCSQETGIVQVKGVERYRQGDAIDVTLEEVRLETRSIIARPV
ncbi:exoribonuclease II [Martelella alba]|uniref:Exoribonuclease 2 n=1 Tax=Martelella alba TaxID=2590451 RepID=A0ABY2SPS9_9HYPH|nr:exoribonuclease II [Martelella alba]TKI08107.1 exoribonuclease II [Martelella alba]